MSILLKVYDLNFFLRNIYSDSIYIQVKSGIISESCFCKVICNWLLLDKTASDAVILFAENELEALSSDTTKDTIFDYILQGKEKKALC